MSTHLKRQKHVEMLGLFGVGILLLVIALFFDPVGPSPDTGVIDLGSVGAKQLLGAFGVFFVVGGLVALIKNKAAHSK